MIDVIVQLLISFTVLSSPLWIIAGIVLLIVAKGKEPAKKKSLMWWGISCLVFPFVLLFLVLSVWGLVNIAAGTYMK